MSLRLVESKRGESTEGPRILAKGAPPSAGPIPNELAQHLHHGEALVWWDDKDGIEWGPVLLTAGAAAVALLLVSGFAPELWQQPWSGLWPPLLALASPTLFVLLRERLSRRALLITDSAIISVEPDGRPQRLAFTAIAAVGRDRLRGGMRLVGARGTVILVPATLADDTRAAIAAARASTIRTQTVVDDPSGWLP
jgi:hypothetical protein